MSEQRTYSPEEIAAFEAKEAKRKMLKPPPAPLAPVNAAYVHDCAELAGRLWADEKSKIVADAVAEVVRKVRLELLAEIDKLKAENAELRQIVYGETFHGA